MLLSQTEGPSPLCHSSFNFLDRSRSTPLVTSQISYSEKDGMGPVLGYIMSQTGKISTCYYPDGNVPTSTGTLNAMFSGYNCAPT